MSALASGIDTGPQNGEMSELKVIGAGLGRTGTLSLKVALELLGFGPCYHMLDVFERPHDIPQWVAAARGESVDWDGLFSGYQATTDWPGCTFWRTLASLYPNARLLLSVRDPGRWYESMRSTIVEAYERDLSAPETQAPGLLAYRGMIDAVVWQGTFGGSFPDRERAIQVFERHAEDVKRAVPPERLLVYEPGQGWEPLCAFLDVPVPDQPFPHLNDAASFRARLEAGRGPGLLAGPAPGDPPPAG
jgi:hypothetical protein